MINVVYLANGFPTADNPSHGIFNQRAANSLKDQVRLTVIQYRLYKPGRKFVEKVAEKGFTRIIICVPYIPVMQQKMHYINNRLFYQFTKWFAAPAFRAAHVVHASDGNLGVFASWLKKKYRFRLLVQFIGGDLNQDLPQFSQQGWMRNWVSKLDAIAFNSKALQKRFIEMFGIHPLSRVIYRGVDTTVFKKKQAPAQPILSFYFLGGLPNYTSFSHGRNTKGGFHLMEAWAKLDAAFPSADMKLLFAGPDSDLPEVETWRKSLPSPEKVVIGGKVDPAMIPAFHQNGNIALIPSLEEGLPNVAMEAAATGNLVIANPVGGIPEIIIDGENGFLCKSNEATGLYDQMRKVMENPSLVEKIGERAAAMITRDFSSIHFAKNYADYYRQLLNEDK